MSSIISKNMSKVTNGKYYITIPWDGYFANKENTLLYNKQLYTEIGMKFSITLSNRRTFTKVIDNGYYINKTFTIKDNSNYDNDHGNLNNSTLRIMLYHTFSNKYPNLMDPYIIKENSRCNHIINIEKVTIEQI